MRRTRVLHRARDGWNRRLVKYQLDTFERAPERPLVRQPALDKIHVAAYLFDVLPVSGRKVVDDTHARALRRERRRDVRADKTSPARNQHDA